MQPQAFFRLSLARSKLVKEFGYAFKMRGKFCLYLNVRAIYEFLLEGVECRRYALRDAGSQIVRAAIQFSGLRFQDLFQAAMELVQSIVAGCFELRRIFLRAACDGLDFRQGRARSRDFVVQGSFDLRKRLAGFGSGPGPRVGL